MSAHDDLAPIECESGDIVQVSGAEHGKLTFRVLLSIQDADQAPQTWATVQLTTTECQRLRLYIARALVAGRRKPI